MPPPAETKRHPAEGTATRPPMERALIASLDRYFSNQFLAGEPGGAVLIMKHDRIVFARGYGLADMTTREPISTHTLFNVGSISKTFVANAILVLRDSGKLSVEDDLLKYFSGFKNKEIASRVRIKHLLTHSSGLPDNRHVDKNPTFYLTAKDAENWYPITQTDALSFEPGSRFGYSNPAFNGLALIIEQVSGMKWQDFVRARILLPAGMTTSTITDGPHPESGVAHGYDKDTDGWHEADYGEVPTFAAAGNGGVWSSVDELALYEQALRKGVFLSPETIKDSRTIKTFPNWTEPKPPALGWSWFINEPADAPRTIYHTGSQGGFRGAYIAIPEHDVFFVILTNSPRDLKAVVDQLTGELKTASWLD